jgi:hypothetical protein
VDDAAVDAVGSACARESDCPEPLACKVERIDDGDGFPEAVSTTCLPEADRVYPTGVPCPSDDDCLTGLCLFGRCSEVCTEGSCPAGFTCDDVSAIPGGVSGPVEECPAAAFDAARFSACLPETGVLELPLPAAASGEWIVLDVPSGAASFTVIAETEVPVAFVGVWALLGPGATALYTLPATQEEFLAQPIRYFPGDRISAMLVPNTPDVSFVRGIHCVRVGSDRGGEVSSRVRLKMAPDGGAGGALALDVHVLNLVGMGCGVDGLDASTAATHALWQEALGDLGEVFAQAGIEIGPVRYHDIPDRPDLDVIDFLDGPDGDGVYEELNALFSAGTGASADSLDVFLVRHIEGRSGVSGAIPGPPGVHGTPHAGVAIDMAAPCTMALGTLLAHEIGHQLGLFHNVETGATDPIEDTGEGTDNLMYPASSGVDLTAGQAFVLRANPLIR